jgi:hypothetical protein
LHHLRVDLVHGLLKSDLAFRLLQDREARSLLLQDGDLRCAVWTLVKSSMHVLASEAVARVGGVHQRHLSVSVWLAQRVGD